eukprot:6057679-Amphidinium_carterae.1
MVAGRPAQLRTGPRRVPGPRKPLVTGGPTSTLVCALLKKAGKRALGADSRAYHEVLALVRPGDTLEALDIDSASSTKLWRLKDFGL